MRWVCTAVTALGDVLVDRLQKAGRLEIKTETIQAPAKGNGEDGKKKK